MANARVATRPRQVTLAAGIGIAGCLLVVVALFDAMSSVRSVESRDNIQQFLTTPPGNSLGWSPGEVLSVLHGVVLFNGAVAAAAAVLAVYVLLGHKNARLAFTCAAVLLTFTAPFQVGLLSILLAYAAAMMWTRPARDWFAGRSPHPAGTGTQSQSTSGSSPDQPGQGDQGVPGPPPPPQGQEPPPPPQGQEPPPPPQGQEPPPPPEGQEPPPASHPYGQPGPYAQPSPYGRPAQPYAAQRPDPSWPPPAYGQVPSGPLRRPGTVTAACVLAWLFSGIVLLVFGVLVVLMLTDQNRLLEVMRREGAFANSNQSTLLSVAWVLSALFIFWSLAAIVLAGFTLRGHNWARLLLAVSAAVSALFSVFAFPFGLVSAAAAVVAVILLFAGNANPWFAQRSGYPRPPYGGPPPPPQGGEKPPSNVW